MKRLIVIGTLVLIPALLAAQGNSLKFNRVIDTVLVAEISSCVDLTANGYSGAAITVPAGCVWKIESMGPLNYSSSAYLHYDCSSPTNYSNSAMVWGIKVDDGSAEKGFLKRRIYTGGSYNIESIEGIVWLRAGTSLASYMGSNNTSYRYTYNASSSPYYCKIHLTIIEFLVVPN